MTRSIVEDRPIARWRLPFRPGDMPQVSVPMIGVCIALALILVPLGSLVVFSLRTGAPWAPGHFTFDNYAIAYGSSQTYLMLGRTFVFALASTAVSLVIATVLAFLTERTDIPFRNAFWALTLLPLAIPGLLFAVSWTFLLSPKIGLYNLWLRDFFGLFGVELDSGPFDVYSLWGMILIEGLRGVATNFIIIVGAFRNMDPNFEDAARMAGASNAATVRRIFLPLMIPVLLSAGIYSFMTHLESLEIPLVIGFPSKVYVFSSYIYFTTQRMTPPQFGLSSALGASFLIISILLVIGYRRYTGSAGRFATVTGKAFRPSLHHLGKWRWPCFAVMMVYLLLTVAGPSFILVWSSLLPYYAPPALDMLEDLSFAHYGAVLGDPTVRKAIVNSLILAAMSATITMTLALSVAWVVVRSRRRLAGLIDILMFLPHALPGVIIGIALMLVFVQPPLGQLGLFGSSLVISFGLTVSYIAFGSRTMIAALKQIGSELEEAGSSAGAGWTTIMRRIVLPLLISSFIGGFIWIGSQAMRNLSIPLMLSTRETETLSIVMWRKWSDGYPGQTATLGILLVLFVACTGALGRYLSTRKMKA